MFFLSFSGLRKTIDDAAISMGHNDWKLTPFPTFMTEIGNYILEDFCL